MNDLAAPTAPARLGEAARDRGSGRVLTGEWEGRPVLVRRLPGSPDRTVRATVDLLAHRLVGLDGPGLVPVLATASDWQALDLILASPSVVGSLATWTRQHPLRSGEVVGVGLRLAAALAHLHAAGLTHGRLHAGDVLVGTDGEVLLTGYGVAGILGSAGSADEDARDLVALLLLLCPEVGGVALRGFLQSLPVAGALDDLLDGLEHCGIDPEPLRVRDDRLPVPRPVPPPGRATLRSFARRTVGWLVPSGTPSRAFGRLLPAALGVVILAGWLGAHAVPEQRPTAEPRPVATPAAPSGPTAAPPAGPTAAPAAGSGSAPTVSTVPTTPAAPDWRGLVDELNQRRAALFAHPDPARLGEVDAPGSSAYASDAAIVRALQTRGAAARGADTTVVSLRVRSAGPVRTDVEVVDRLAAHSIVSTGGSVLERRPGRGARTTVLALVRGDAGWRVAQVLPG